MSKLKVGQIIYSLNVGNEAIRIKQKLTEYFIVKVGRKYFSIAEKIDEHRGFFMTQFHIDTLGQKSDYSPTHKLYLDPSDWKNEQEEETLCGKFKDIFEYGRNSKKLSLSALRGIDSIIENNIERMK